MEKGKMINGLCTPNIFYPISYCSEFQKIDQLISGTTLIIYWSG